MEDEEIQNMESDENTAPREPFSVVVEQSPVRRGEEKGRTAVEGMIQNEVSDGGDPDSNEIDESTAVEQSPVASDSKHAIQVAVALALVGGSLSIILAVPRVVNEAGRAVMGDTIAFNVLLVADMVALLASLAVGMILATVSHISAKMEYLICTSLWTAAVCFLLTFHGAAYVVVLPNHKSIVLCFGGAVTIALALLLFYQLSMVFYHVFSKGRVVSRRAC